MLRVIKFLSLCGLVVAVVGGVWIATHDLDLSGWRPEVEAAVRAATGRELSLEGELEVDLWPTPRIFASGLAFSNAAWGSRPDMLTAREVTISLEPMPLLRGDVNVQGIRMSGVDLIVEIDPEGRGNWEMGADGGEGGDLDLFEKLTQLEVYDLTIEWRDPARPVHVADMDAVRLTANRMGGFDIDVSGELNGKPRQLEGQLSSFSAYLGGEGLRGRVVSTTPDLESTFEGNLGRFPLTDGMDLRVSASGRRWPIFSNFTGLPTGETPPWGIAFRVRGTPGFLEITEAEAGFEGGRITGSLMLNRQGETTRVEDLDLQVDAAGERWPYLAAMVGFPEGPLPPWDVEFRVGGHESLIEISELVAQLDVSDLAGTLTVDLRRDVPRVEGELRSDMLDVSTPERWWQGTLEQEALFEETGKLFSEAPVQTDWMDGVDLKLAIAADTLRTEDLTVQDATLTILLDGRRLEAGLEAEAFGGRGSTSLKADASRTPMAYWQRTEILDADMGGVSEDWFGAAIVDAPGRFRYEISGSGNSVAEFMGNATGSASLVLGEGTARAGVAERAVRGLATMALATLLQARRVEDVEMNCMISEVKIEEGVATFEVLVLDTERATVVGSGEANLREQSWDVWFKPRPKRFALNAAVPVHMTGPFHAPEISVQKIGVLRKIAGAVSLFVFPPAAVAGLVEFGAGNPCVELLEADD